MNEVRTHLFDIADKDYKTFSEKLSPTANFVIGVRVPALRKYAKEICKGDYIKFLDEFTPQLHEERMLKGIVIAYAKIPLDVKIDYIKKFVPFIEDWSVCDIMCNSFKFKESELETVFEYICYYKDSKKEYELRFMVVMFLNYFLKPNYSNKVLKIVDDIHVDYYYTNMAIAWMLAEMVYRCREDAIKYFENNNQNKFTINKAIQKVKESYRVSEEDKVYLSRLKRK